MVENNTIKILINLFVIGVKKQHNLLRRFILVFKMEIESHILTNRKEREQRQQLDNKVKNVKDYLRERVMPLLGPLQIAVLQRKPSDLAGFCVEYLRQRNQGEIPGNLFGQVENQQFPQQMFRKQVRQKLRTKRNGSRQGIVGDRPKSGFIATGKQFLSKPTQEHSEQDKVKLILYLKKCMFFQHLSTSQLIKIAQRTKILQFKSGDVLIRQGESGNELYIVDSGLLKCQKDGSNEILKYCTRGEIFGQLSLLYNNPRASTVTAIEGGRLFSLQRPYFSAVLHLGVSQKLRECQELVERIDIFDSLNMYQKNKLYQSMQFKAVGPQRYIIRQSEHGNCFYIVAEGQLVAYKQQQGQNRLVYTYKRGDYFGEIALLSNLPRQASVKTVTDVRLYFINAEAFSRVLGPLESILRRNQERYTRWVNELQK